MKSNNLVLLNIYKIFLSKINYKDILKNNLIYYIYRYRFFIIINIISSIPNIVLNKSAVSVILFNKLKNIEYYYKLLNKITNKKNCYNNLLLIYYINLFINTNNLFFINKFINILCYLLNNNLLSFKYNINRLSKLNLILKNNNINKINKLTLLKTINKKQEKFFICNVNNSILKINNFFYLGSNIFNILLKYKSKSHLDLNNRLVKIFNEYKLKYNSNILYNFNKYKNYNNVNYLSLFDNNFKYSTFENNKNINLDLYFNNYSKYWYYNKNVLNLLFNKHIFNKILKIQKIDSYFLELNFKNKNFFFILKKKSNVLDKKSYIIQTWTAKSLKIINKNSKEKIKLNIIDETAIKVGFLLKNNYNIAQNKLIIIVKTNIYLKQNFMALNGLRQAGFFINNINNNSVENIIYLNKISHNGLRAKKIRRL